MKPAPAIQQIESARVIEMPASEKERLRLTQKSLDKLERPATGAALYWDDDVPGFGVRVSAMGTTAFILNYRIKGQQRRFTIGRHGLMSLAEARSEAHKLYSDIRRGIDPLAAKSAKRQRELGAQTVADLSREYFERHASKNKRASSQLNDRRILDNLILPRLGNVTVPAITSRHIEKLHSDLHATPYHANRVLALLSKMFALAVLWHREDPVWRSDNPVLGIKHYHEERRERWLDAAELERLNAALDGMRNQNVANAFRLLMLTGARKGEILSATWQQIDLERKTWTKPSAHTKQKREHIVPLSEAALEILSKMKRAAGDDDGFLFHGQKSGTHLSDLKQDWGPLCRAAKLSGVRIHDLRHSFASHLVSGGVPLFVVGKLLGHSQSATTERYAHVADDVQREATNRFEKLIKR